MEVGIVFTMCRAAAVSFEPWKWHKRENTARFVECCRAAARAGAELIVGPESALDGYVTYDAIDCPELRARMLDLAEPLDGPLVRSLRDLAKELRVCLAFGFAERTGPRSVHNAAVFVDPRGELAGHAHKMQFAEGYHPDWYFNRLGETTRSFDTPRGRCGLLICHDRWNPHLARALVLDGARYLCIVTHGNRSEAQDRAVTARARENGVPIVQANVGHTLIISCGEVAARDTGTDLITLGTIAIPEAPSENAARAVEQRFLAARPDHMRTNLAIHCRADKVVRRARERLAYVRPAWGPIAIRNH